MGWFNKNEENAAGGVNNMSLPLPSNTNCDFTGLDWNAWKMFCEQNRFYAVRVRSWLKLYIDYYKGTLDDGSVIFYDYACNGVRCLSAEEAQFSTMLDWQKEFARRLIKAMDYSNINQQLLAEKTGISQPSLSCYMSAKKIPSAYTIATIAKALDCPIDFLAQFT